MGQDDQPMRPPHYDDPEDGGEPPPTYEESNNAMLRGDGRIDVDPNSRLSRTLSRLYQLPPIQIPEAPIPSPAHQTQDPSTSDGVHVRLNIVIQVVGSRGDIQPFAALGRGLQAHGHRVRLATHARFQDFIHDAGLEFHPIGGDPEELMSYMVRNPGLIPSMSSLRAGEIAQKREMIAAMLEGCWKSCIEPDPLTGAPFVADAIIANPPSFAHVHCADALGIPLHIMFTMPWTSTRSFPHPLANLVSEPKNPSLMNYLSYVTVQWMTWQGIGDVINDWRRRLDLEPVPNSEGPMLTETLKIPHTYCWSPAVVPKPADWPAHIDVSGFFFRSNPVYSPQKELQDFLDAGPPPIYIGFGSIVLDQPEKMASTLIDAVAETEGRAIISRGWSRLDGGEHSNIFWLEDCPHEWLFQHVSMVVHHGGAGTTACGLLNAKPTIVVPFFGDQAFWGGRIAAAGAGPEPIPHKALNASNLAAAIRFCESQAARDAAATIASMMKAEDGVQSAVRSFHNNLPLERMKCAILPEHPASWVMKIGGKPIRLSALAAEVLIQEVGLNPRNLKLYQSDPKFIEARRWDPVTGTASSLVGTGAGMVNASLGIFLEPHKVYMRERGRTPSPNSVRRTDSSGTKSLTSLPSSRTSSLSDVSKQEEGLQSVTAADVPAPPRDNAIAGSMASASGKSLGRFFSTYTKGFLVDMPMAAAEGFRAVPRLWGDEVEDYGRVTDWKSGATVAGKTFIQGIGDGFRDIAMQPVEGGRKEGAWGAIKGVAKGSSSLVTKTVGGSLGLVAYPGQGIAKSLFSLAHAGTGKKIAAARRVDGAIHAEIANASTRAMIVDHYHGMVRPH